MSSLALVLKPEHDGFAVARAKRSIPKGRRMRGCGAGR
jgi:hypothetical protein